MVRDHAGSYLDPLTLDTLNWTFLPPTADEPVALIDVEKGICKMPTAERWALFTHRGREGKIVRKSTCMIGDPM